MIVSLIDIYSLVLFAAVVLSWVQLPADNPLVRFVRALTEPLLAPIRKLLPNVGGFDLSPMIVFGILRLLRRLVTGL
ncbi:MAG TPA: YggT family protein [Polyangiaceae bacterium]|nr:YggT family protein [Polyangiaceae bacterium]